MRYYCNGDCNTIIVPAVTTADISNEEKGDSLKVAKIDIYFGNLDTITLLFITVHPYVSTNECVAVARPIPLPIYC